MELWILGALEDVFGFITSGSIGGLPPIVVMIIPFVIGLIVGYLVHKMLKIAIIAAIILVVVSLLRLFRSESWRVERSVRQIWSNSNSIRDTSHRHATARRWIHSRFNHRLHILLNMNTL